MTKLDWTLIGVGSVSVLGISWYLDRTKVETRLHVLNRHKFVDADPAGLARAAGVSLDNYALASAMQSEENTRIARIAIGCAIRNHCRQSKTSVSAYLLSSIDKHGRHCASHGRFGSQEAPGKKVATSKSPTADTLILANQILTMPSPIIDPTHGATRWYAPSAQDRGHQRDPDTYSLDAKQLKAKLILQGGRPIMVDGVPNTLFWAFA